MDWLGPVVIHRGAADGLPECGDPYPAAAPLRLEGFNDPDPAVCECSCGAHPLDCNFGPAISPGGCGAAVIPEEGCNRASVEDADFGLEATHDGACERTFNEELPEIPWDAVVRTCEGAASADTCDAGARVCINNPPDGFEARICIIGDGDLPCPAGDYAEKIVVYDGADDTRACSDCVCGEAVCDAEYEFYLSDDCSGEPAGTIADGDCEQLTLSSFLVDFSDASCPVATMSAPEGGATASGPKTYCCAGA